MEDDVEERGKAMDSGLSLNLIPGTHWLYINQCRTLEEFFFFICIWWEKRYERSNTLSKTQSVDCVCFSIRSFVYAHFSKNVHSRNKMVGNTLTINGCMVHPSQNFSLPRVIGHSWVSTADKGLLSLVTVTWRGELSFAIGWQTSKPLSGWFLLWWVSVWLPVYQHNKNHQQT